MADIRRPRMRRFARMTAAVTAAVAAGSLAVACTASTTTHAGPTEDAPKPTVVLVHGAFADGSTNKFPGSTLPGTLDPVAFTGTDGSAGTDLYIQQASFHEQFAADVPADRAALAAAAQRPIAQAALEEKAIVSAWTDKPSWDVITTQDLNIPVAAQRFMAERAHAQVTEIAASHSVAVSHPDRVAEVIERTARDSAH
ncbi:alpha/beta hydrolase [Nocardia abscessus]|uniref:alpha/beta hydrolase n=1 Tax=Nocardia abscessus TaxID=120957 RepID=UPI001895B9AB|nr:alpha/beta hydrolase [Nocardia abscessus]MBF6341195.1 alpha/beta hydrolase [Nocardia abscessus]